MNKDTCYIGIAGGAEMIHFAAYASIMNMDRQPGDSLPMFIQGTKGYEVRQKHFDAFIASDYEYMLLLDSDMVFQQDTLTRLRSHNKKYISGLYLFRSMNMQQIWFEPFDGAWPYMPVIDPPERGRLHEIGASGWGCILLHRDVVTDTREILKGERDVLEDDMDVWPYEDYSDLRTLRGDKQTIIGSDIRYPFYALHAGHQLYGDPDVRPRHLLTYGLHPDDYERLTAVQLQEMKYNAMAARGNQ